MNRINRINGDRLDRPWSLEGTFPIKVKAWFFSSIVWGLVFFNFLLLFLVLISVPVSFDYYINQVSLCFSFIFSLMLLADKPLLTPIQALVFIFFLWFGFGPNSIIVFQSFIESDPLSALTYARMGEKSILIVCLGLPIYAISAQLVMKLFSRTRWNAAFLQPESFNYKTRTIFIFFLLGLSASLITVFFSLLGIKTFSYTSYLGGTVTHIWWVGVFATFERLLRFGISALAMMFFCSDTRKRTKIIILLIIVFLAVDAIFSGWKGAFLFPFVYLMVSYIAQRQKLPVFGITLVLLFFLVFVQPFVSSMRTLAELKKIQDPQERVLLIKENVSFDRIIQYPKKIEWGSFFRGIFPLAGNIVDHAGLLEGEWGGQTIMTGLAANIPRILYPEKPKLNIGNFFYKKVFARTYNIRVTSDINNVAVSVPFEFIGNFGILAGILSFGLIGIFWASICCFVLSPVRLWNHPLTPYFVLFSLSFEQPVGHICADIRDLLIMFLILWLVNKIIPVKKIFG